jgi:hypothetical protein
MIGRLARWSALGVVAATSLLSGVEWGCGATPGASGGAGGSSGGNGGVGGTTGGPCMSDQDCPVHYQCCNGSCGNTHFYCMDGACSGMDYPPNFTCSCTSSASCAPNEHCTTEDGECSRPPGCGSTDICPAVCYGMCALEPPINPCAGKPCGASCDPSYPFPNYCDAAGSCIRSATPQCPPPS